MRPLVVGIGRRDRGDDAAGLLVAAALRQRGPVADVVTVATPLQLVDVCRGRELVVVVDAVRPGGTPGQVTVTEAGTAPLQARSGAGGSHAFGVIDAIDLARALGRLPGRLVLIGIEAGSTRPGRRLTPAVAAAVDAATDAAVEALAWAAREKAG